MSEAQLITLIAQSSGTLGLAIFTIWMLNRVWEDRCRSAERYAADMRSMWDQTRSVVEENTTAIVRLVEKLERG